jgi:hypothetical protein
LPNPDHWNCFSESGAKKIVVLTSFEESVLNEIFLAIQSDRVLSIKAYLSYRKKQIDKLREEGRQLLKRASDLETHALGIELKTYGRLGVLTAEQPKGINFKDGLENAIAKLAEIEGESWGKRQRDNTGCTVATLYLAWERTQKEDPLMVAECPKELVEPSMWNLRGDSAIYGETGHTRYFVHLDGTVVACRYHMPENSPKIEKVEAMGIPWY